MRASLICRKTVISRILSVCKIRKTEKLDGQKYKYFYTGTVQTNMRKRLMYFIVRHQVLWGRIKGLLLCMASLAFYKIFLYCFEFFFLNKLSKTKCMQSLLRMPYVYIPSCKFDNKDLKESPILKMSKKFCCIIMVRIY